MVSWIKNIVTILIVFWLAYYLYTHWDSFSAIQSVSVWHVSLVSVGILLTWVVNSVQVNLLLSAHRIKVGIIENLLVQTMAILCNYLPMRIGTVMRFGYFKKIHQIEFSSFGGIVAVRGVMLLVSSCLVSMFFFALASNTLNSWCFFIIINCGFIIIAIIGYKTRFNYFKFGIKNKKITAVIDKFLIARIVLFENPYLSVQLFVLILIQFSLLAIRLFICFSAIGVEVDILTLMVVAPTAIVLSFVTITPGNLGLREWAMSLITASLGYDFELAMFAGLIDRAVLTGLTFFFGSFSYWYVWEAMKSKK